MDNDQHPPPHDHTPPPRRRRDDDLTLNEWRLLAVEKELREKIGRREFELRVVEMNGAINALQGELRSRCASIDKAVQKGNDGIDALRNRVVTVGLTVSTVVIAAMGILLAVHK